MWCTTRTSTWSVSVTVSSRIRTGTSVATSKPVPTIRSMCAGTVSSVSTGGDGEVGLPHRDGQHDLYRAVVGERVARAQCLVPGGDVGGGGPQRGVVQRPGQAQRDGDVVGRGRRVELVDEPHALLRRGQRDHRRPGHGGERGPGGDVTVT